MNHKNVDRNDDPFAAARFAARHPVFVSLLSGAILGLSPAGWGLPVLVLLAVAGGMVVLQFLIWMPWGPGARWVRNLPPVDTQSKSRGRRSP